MYGYVQIQSRYLYRYVIQDRLSSTEQISTLSFRNNVTNRKLEPQGRMKDLNLMTANTQMNVVQKN
jgi:hypothetical protein